MYSNSISATNEDKISKIDIKSLKKNKKKTLSPLHTKSQNKLLPKVYLRFMNMHIIHMDRALKLLLGMIQLLFWSGYAGRLSLQNMENKLREAL